jgi:ADP-ribose pyrophosphatase
VIVTDDCELKVWETLHRRQLVDAAPWLRLWVETVRLPDGRIVDDYYTLEQPDYVIVFALTNAQEVIGIWHYKHGPRRVNLGLPAGYVLPFEDALTAAQRELLEETGYQAAVWQLLGTFTVDGNRGGGQAHIYLAEDLRAVTEPDADDLEEIKLDLVSLIELRQHLQTGRVATLGAAAAIALGLNVVTNSVEGSI